MKIDGKQPQPEERQERPCDVLADPRYWTREHAPQPPGPVEIEWIDDNDGRGPVRISRPVRCY